jgi:hypothetical protein
MYIVCRNIVEKLNSEFGNRWHCMASYNNWSNSFFSYESGYLIKLKFGGLMLEIYKTQFVCQIILTIFEKLIYKINL